MHEIIASQVSLTSLSVPHVMGAYMVMIDVSLLDRSIVSDTGGANVSYYHGTAV